MLADSGEAIAELAVPRNEPDLFGLAASDPTAWRALRELLQLVQAVTVLPGRPADSDLFADWTIFLDGHEDAAGATVLTYRHQAGPPHRSRAARVRAGGQRSQRRRRGCDLVDIPVHRAVSRRAGQRPRRTAGAVRATGDPVRARDMERRADPDDVGPVNDHIWCGNDDLGGCDDC
jgi:hypothetical protein